MPSEADIQPGGDLQVAIKFQPDHERPWLFHQNLRVQVPNQVKEHTIFLSGRCHARQMYAVGNDLDSDAARQIPESMEDPFMVPTTLRSMAIEAQQSVLGVSPAVAPEIKLTFPRDDPDATRTITVGCLEIVNPDLKGGPGTYELEWDPEMAKLGYFSATPDKGNVAPGNTVEVTFSFSPPVIEETYGLDVGQWSRTVVKCNLKGGYAPEGSPEAAVRILLEGYIPV